MWTWVVFWVRGWRFWTHLDSICVKRRGHTCCIKHVNVSTPQNLPFPCGLPLVILWRTQNMSGWWFQTWMDYFLLLSMGFSFHNWLVVSIMFIFHFIYGIILPIDFHSIIFQDGLLHHHNYGKSPCSMGKSTISMVNHQMFDAFPSWKPPFLMRRSAFPAPAHHGVVSSPIPKGSFSGAGATQPGWAFVDDRLP